MRISKIMAASVMLLVGLGLVAKAGAQTHYASQPRGNSVKIQGTSKFHDWEMQGPLIGGFIEFGPGVTFDPSATSLPGLVGGKVPVKAHAFISVRSLRSEADHLPEYMERLMQEALKENQFKRIDFNLTDMTFKGPHAAGTPFAFDATGSLEIAGVTNKITMPVTIEPVEGDKIKVSGTAPIKMTQYGITPPAPNWGMGMARCGDDVKIIFEWVLVQRK